MKTKHSEAVFGVKKKGIKMRTKPIIKKLTGFMKDMQDGNQRNLVAKLQAGTPSIIKTYLDIFQMTVILYVLHFCNSP